MTLGADIGLGGGGEGQGGVTSTTNADDARQSRRLMPWEGSTFRTPSVYEMAFCACEIHATYYTLLLEPLWHSSDTLLTFLFRQILEVRARFQVTAVQFRIAGS